MKNLSKDNIYRDAGEIPFDIINDLESRYGIKLPHVYREFIMKHNGARLDIDSFDFYDQVREMHSREGLAFMKVENIQETIDDLLDQSTNDPNCDDIFKFYKYFSDRLIPFGDTGGGDFICFDYRNHNGDNPLVGLWCHDNYDKNWNRTSFIAKNFEEFINMLHESEN